jgi:PAS domain S-box-containing protein
VSLVPEPARSERAEDFLRTLGDTLEGLVEFTGATGGWVGLAPAGRLTFPVRRGTVADTWLTLQQARAGVWGFEVLAGPTLLNDLRPFPPLGDPPLRNLLSCPLTTGGTIRGQLVLVNKPSGFTSQDAAVLQAGAHLMQRPLSQLESRPRPALELPSLMGRLLDRVEEGVVVVDPEGTLVFANATWLSWTGFSAADVLGHPAPFPFWVSQRDLAVAGKMADAMPAGTLPFRRRDQSLFWCRVQVVTEEWQGRPLTVAYLHQVSLPAASAPPPTRRPVTLPLLLDDLPFALALTDRQGQLLWANAALEGLAPGETGTGKSLGDCFTPASAALLNTLLQDPTSAQPGRIGSLVLERGGVSLPVFWLAVGLAEGPGFLLALGLDAGGLVGRVGERDQRAVAATPASDWLALLVQPEEVGFWNERWEQRTGRPAGEVAKVRADVVLDWLFPRQRDRERVADWLQPGRPGGQDVLNVLTRTGSRPMLCTCLPLGSSTAPGRWLLIGELERNALPGSPSLDFVRRFSQGLSRLLRHYLALPTLGAEADRGHTDLPSEVDRLIAALEDLAAPAPAATEMVPLAELVREFLTEVAPGLPRAFDLNADLRDTDVPVRIDRRMIRVVLGHLWTNAVQALPPTGRRQIDVRVQATEEEMHCEIRDSGEGFAAEEWSRSLAPFFSTKGVFAHDPAHAVQEGLGLGLTVSQHLLALHQGRLEIRSAPSRGTTAAIILPRADNAVPATAPNESVRIDTPASARGPHSKPNSSVSEPPQT